MVYFVKGTVPRTVLSLRMSNCRINKITTNVCFTHDNPCAIYYLVFKDRNIMY